MENIKNLIKNYTHFITDENQNKWEVIETSDLEEINEAYHFQKTKDIVNEIEDRIEHLKLLIEMSPDPTIYEQESEFLQSLLKKLQ